MLDGESKILVVNKKDQRLADGRICENQRHYCHKDKDEAARLLARKKLPEKSSPDYSRGGLLISRRALAHGYGRNDNRGLAPYG